MGCAVKKRSEIRRILVSELGFTDLEAYKRWVEEVRPTMTITDEDIERLSPDAVDCRAFLGRVLRTIWNRSHLQRRSSASARSSSL